MTPPLLQIEKGIPMPLRGEQLWHPLRPQILKMEPGQSFRLPAALTAARLSTYAKRWGVKLSVRKVQEGNWRGHRVWRIAATENVKLKP